MPRVYTSSRSRIVEVAQRLLVEKGVGHMTVDDVVRAAGVSKGAFFHHFATKDALLLGLLGELTSEVAAEISALAAKDPEPRGARMRAHIRLGLDPKHWGKWSALAVAMVEVARLQPTVTRRLRRLNAEALALDVAEGIDPGNAACVQLALDGFWLNQSQGTTAFSRAQIEALQQTLLGLARPRGAATRGAKR